MAPDASHVSKGTLFLLGQGEQGHVAMQVDEPAVWTELAHAQLDHGDVAEAIASYLRAGDSSRYADVIARSQEAACYDELVKYLLMVRKKVKDNKVRLATISHAGLHYGMYTAAYNSCIWHIFGPCLAWLWWRNTCHGLNRMLSAAFLFGPVPDGGCKAILMHDIHHYCMCH